MQRLLVTFAVTAATLFVTDVSSRAVNISNTWMLPEEGFPVFYRYFRDRISWYEADAVCQFHHANLVTVDSTSQYDAIRAYLKELDIANNVWIGLSRSNDKPVFSWPDLRPIEGEGHWQESIPAGNSALCAAMDPAADFRWHAFSCGGPEIASFICELPVPDWATGSGGCLLTALPSLTVLYIPEQSALELTSDCGLDGTRRIACKGNADHEEMMRQLSCGITNEDFDEKSTKPSPTVENIPTETSQSSSLNNYKVTSTKPSMWDSNTIDYSSETRHRRGTDNTVSPVTITSTTAVHGSPKITATTNVPVSAHVESASTTVDVTADPNAVHKSLSDKSQGLTVQRELTTPESNGQTIELQAEIAVTTEFKAEEDNGEYPGSISQGRLFSILENGTIFDILELNETVMETDTTSEKEASTQAKTTASPSSLPEDLFTTVQYNKEPPSDNTFVTNNGLRKISKSVKKQITPTEYSSWESSAKSQVDPNSKDVNKEKTSNDLPSKDDDKVFSQEIGLFPVVGNSLVKLNRTNRKELTMIEFNSTKDAEDLKDMEVDDSFMIPKHIDSFADVDNDINGNANSNEHQHKVIEIKITGPTDSPHLNKKLYITTKLSPSASKGKMPKKVDKTFVKPLNNKDAQIKVETTTENLKIETQLFTQDTKSPALIDPKIDQLNMNITKNNESEDIPTATVGTTQVKVAKELHQAAHVVKKQFLPKSLLSASEKSAPDVIKEISSEELENVQSERNENEITEDPIEPVPQEQPRPNRARQLTRPQRKSFYPYFFSRVLG